MICKSLVLEKIDIVIELELITYLVLAVLRFERLKIKVPLTYPAEH